MNTTHCFTFTLRTLALAAALSINILSQADTFSYDVFTPELDGSKYYRAPVIVSAGNNTLVAIADRRYATAADFQSGMDLVCRTSTDGGATWSDAVEIAPGLEPYGYAAAAYDATRGRVVCLFAQGSAFSTDNLCKIYVTTSDDGGASWATPSEVTSQFTADVSNLKNVTLSNGSMLCLPDGTLMVATVTRSYKKTLGIISNSHSYVRIYKSTDGGASWSRCNANDNPVDADYKSRYESKLATLADGSMLLTLHKDNKRQLYRSTDGGATWSGYGASFPTNGANGDVISYTDAQTGAHYLIGVGADNYIYSSYNEGASWNTPSATQIPTAEATSIATCADGSIAILAACGNDTDAYTIRLYRVALNDIVPTGRLCCLGSNYLTVAQSDDFNIAEGGQFTVSAKIKVADWDKTRAIVATMWHPAQVIGSCYNNMSGFELTAGASADNCFYPNILPNGNYGGSTNDPYDYGIPHTQAATAGKITPGEYATITWVFDDREGYQLSKTYINGALCESVSTRSVDGRGMNMRSAMLIGARYKQYSYNAGKAQAECVVNTGEIWTGEIDDVRFYNTALTDDEVKQDHLWGYPISASTANGGSLIAAYDFQAFNADGTYPDISGNGHHATAVNGSDYTVFAPMDNAYTVTNGGCDPAEGGSITITRYADGAEVSIDDSYTYSHYADYKVTATAADGYALTGIYLNDERLPLLSADELPEADEEAVDKGLLSGATFFKADGNDSVITARFVQLQPTFINDIHGDDAAERHAESLIYYDLHGRRLASKPTAAGCYIRMCDGCAHKYIVR
ncbi:MAG: exo-alpha-sialidase [Muribaculaceae bacterium]